MGGVAKRISGRRGRPCNPGRSPMGRSGWGRAQRPARGPGRARRPGWRACLQHDVPLVEVVLLAVFAEEEDAIDSPRAQHLGKFLDQGEVVDDSQTLVLGKRHDLLVLLQEGSRVVGIVSEWVAWHIGEEVHLCEPIKSHPL